MAPDNSLRLARIEGKLTVLLWAAGINAAATLAVFSMLLPISRQLGEISGQLARLVHTDRIELPRPVSAGEV